jgi:hypothetical protein
MAAGPRTGVDHGDAAESNGIRGPEAGRFRAVMLAPSDEPDADDSRWSRGLVTGIALSVLIWTVIGFLVL